MKIEDRIEIDCVSNYYGCLNIGRKGDKFYWAIENYDGFYWTEIPHSLYMAIYNQKFAFDEYSAEQIEDLFDD